MPSYEDLTFEQVIERLEELANPRPPGEPNGHQLTVVVPTAPTRLLELAQLARARLGKPETGFPAHGDD